VVVKLSCSVFDFLCDFCRWNLCDSCWHKNNICFCRKVLPWWVAWWSLWICTGAIWY